MALIYRSIFEVEDDAADFIERLPRHVENWLRYKLRDPNVEFRLEEYGDFSQHGLEITSRAGSDESCSVARVEAYEGSRDDGVEVKTTVTAICSSAQSWAWVDVERWTHSHRATPWIPAPPGIAVTLLLNERASSGDFALTRSAVPVTGDGGALAAELVLNPERTVPFVVVSYNEREDGGMALASERGRELAKSLAGVAVVYVLQDGAVSRFSRAMYDAVGEGMDVHSGAIRTYLPGAGASGDSSARHRYVPFRKLEGRRADLSARIIAPHLLRRAVESPPPPIWRASARALLIGHEPDTVYDELLTEADNEIAGLRSEATRLQEELEVERLDNIEFQRRNDDLGRRLSFLRDQLRAVQPALLANEPQEPLFEPVLCTEVISQVRASLTMVVIHESVDAGADELDAHGDESWARRAWSAFQALDHYASMKRDGAFDGSFLIYCENAVGDFVIPSTWVVPTETATTLANRKYYDLRVLPVASQVDASGSTLMQEHIRIERGGTPSPRIHYYDDTRGATGQIHVGWFGDHLDSRAKS